METYKLKSSNGREAHTHKVKIIKDLEDNGWVVAKNGWPDVIAFKGDTVKAIYIKNGKLTTRQKLVASILRRFFKVET